MNKIKYYRFPEGFEFVDKHLDATICLRKDNLITSLSDYANNIGNAINDYMVCYFAEECEENMSISEIAIYNIEKETTHTVIISKKDYFDSLNEKIINFQYIFSKEEYVHIRKKMQDLLS